MDNVNYRFYEEFSRLDHLCSEIYQLDNGVGAYLAEMDAVSSAYAEAVPGWIENMEQLYRMFMLRKALAQSAEAFQETICAQEDVDWLHQFGQLIMDRKDPLALMKQHGYRADEDARKRLNDTRLPMEYEADKRRFDRDQYINGPFVVVMMLLTVIATCILFLFIFSKL